MTDSVLTVHYIQRFGAVDRIVSILRRRGFPISSMTLERTHSTETGRMTVVVAEAAAAEQVCRHLSKLPDVLEVQRGDECAVQREYALVRVSCKQEQRAELDRILIAHDARPIRASDTCVVVEAMGDTAAIDRFFTVLAPFGIEESARTNPMMVQCASTTDARRSA